MQCRACLKVNCESVTLLDEYKMKCFNLITDINIHKEDSLPQELCENCAKDLEFCVGFREKCITSNSILVSARTWNEDSKMKIQFDQEHLKCHKVKNMKYHFFKPQAVACDHNNNRKAIVLFFHDQGIKGAHSPGAFTCNVSLQSQALRQSGRRTELYIL